MTSTDPRAHAKAMEQRLKDTIHDLRSEIRVIEDPRAKAMFETAADVLGGLEKAFHGYDDAKDELKWG